MMDFLSDVFEFEVDCLSDSVYRGPLIFKLCEREVPSVDLVDSSTVFSFKVKSEQELKEIMSKYNFFLYRKNSPHALTERLDLVQTDNKKVLTIADIDQRLWRFEFEPSAKAD